MSVEDWDAETVRIMEAQKKNQNYDRLDLHDMDHWDDETIRIMEAQKKNQNYDRLDLHDMDHWSDNMNRAMMAQIEEEIVENNKYAPYYRNMILTGNMENEEQYGKFVDRTIQSGRLMESFSVDILITLNQTADKLLRGSTSKEETQADMERLSSLLVMYEKYLYALKERGFDFKNKTTFGDGYDYNYLKITENTVKKLKDIERKNNIKITMPIPADVGDYGKAYERDGNFEAVLHYIQQDITGHEVDWRGCINLREGELTPYQKYQERQKQKRQAFAEARNQEIQNNIAKLPSLTDFPSNDDYKGYSR